MMVGKSNKNPSRSPPQSLEALRSLVENSASGTDIGLGRKTLATLIKMIETPNRTAVQSISEIASNNGIDPSTLTRLGQRLGFQGFSDLQELFRAHVAKRGDYYSNQTQQLLASSQNNGPSHVWDLADQNIKNVLDTAANLDEVELSKAVEILVRSRRVYILGLRASYSIAHFFSYFLTFLRHEVILLGGPGFTIAEDLARLSQDDVLVAISFRPYTNITISACKSAQIRKVPIIAITDLSSPISIKNETSVTLTAQSPYFINAALANFFLAQALMSAFAARIGVDAFDGLGGFVDQLLDLNIETN